MTWPDGYLVGFRSGRPKITEAALTRTAHRDGRTTPYRWLLDAVPPRGRVLGLACGNTPLWPVLHGGVRM